MKQEDVHVLQKKRLQSIELYIEYDRSADAVVYELGYPLPR